MENIRVLIVDDSRDIRQFVTDYVLKPHGLKSVEATNGAEGVRKALEGEIDLILLDLEMPKMNGFQVLDALRDRHSKIPIILMTSHGSEAIAVEVFRKGVRDYVIKPFDAEDLTASIERALREVRLQREKENLTHRLVQSNRQLEQRVRELDTLYQIGKSVTSLMARKQLLERIADAAIYITGAEEAAIQLHNGDDLHQLVRKRQVQGQNRQESQRTEGELALHAIQKGDVTTTGAMLYAPLQVGERPIGALGVCNKVTARPFNGHDKRLLLALADYAAIALENARLLNQVEKAKEREKQQIRGLFERYVAPSVVEKLMARPEKVQLGGVRQTATILLADIRGFSRFSTRVTPEILVDTLNQHIATAAEAILTLDGTLDKFIGDAVMAYFNAPLPQPDHALRAVRAAWRICRAVEHLHKQLEPSKQLEFGIGVSTGEVLVGNIGMAQLMNFTVIGDAVNVSQRLQEHAKGGQILISQTVHDHVQDVVQAQALEPIVMKGYQKPQPVYEVLAV